MARRLECVTFDPDPTSSNDLFPPNANAAVLLGTPVASKVIKRGERLGDTGARAAALAKLVGAKVIAYQDLGPKVGPLGLPAARQRMSPADFPEYAAECAEALRGHLERVAVKQVVMRVHSGNGPLGTELACVLPDENRGIAVSHVAVSDPVGMQKLTFREGFKRWRDYTFGSEHLTPPDHRNPPRHPRNTLPSFIGDAVVRGTTVWLTSRTLDNLIDIGNNFPRTAVLLHLPGNTLNGTPGQMAALATTIQTRIDRGPENAPFQVSYEPDTFHATTYDNHERNAAFINQTVALAPFGPQ